MFKKIIVFLTVMTVIISAAAAPADAAKLPVKSAEESPKIGEKSFSESEPEAAALSAEPFTDVKKGDAFWEAAAKAKTLGIIKGYGDGSFRPKKKVSYAEFITMLAKGETAEPPAGENISHWAAPAYYYGLSRGWYGKSELDTGLLSSYIPRKNMVKMLARELEISGAAPTNIPSGLFKDLVPKSPTEYNASVCAESKIILGYPDGTFKPENFLTRGEAAAVLVRLSKVKSNEKQSTESGETPEGKGSNEEPPSEPVLPDIPKKMKEIIDEILFSISFDENGGKPIFSYSMPDIPNEYHLSVGARVYEKRGIGTPTVFHYYSDDGWFNDPTKYDPSKKSVSIKMGNFTLSDKSVFCKISLNKPNEKGQSQQLARYVWAKDYDGTQSLSLEFHEREKAEGAELPPPPGIYKTR